jgi:CRP/FNR family cyclic AMP-dependent transcriptional regulator
MMQVTSERIQILPKSRPGEFFRPLSSEALIDFEALEWPTSYPANAVLFREQQICSSVLVLLEGQVKLSLNSTHGRRLILRIGKPGDILGLISAFSGGSYLVTAETLHFCRIGTLRRQDFLSFLKRHPDAYQNLARQLSVEYAQDCERLRTTCLAFSAAEKLAQLLLELCGDASTQLKLPLTHMELGECIGASRETVTRTLKDFKRRQLVEVRGCTLLISNRRALEICAGTVPVTQFHPALNRYTTNSPK